MPSFNKITIVGHLGRDPVLRYTPQGTAVCDFSVATSEKRGGEEYITWFKITCWAKAAELANQYLSKGSLVYVEGRLKQSDYTDRDGVNRMSLEVNAIDVQFIGAKRTESDAPPQARAASAPSTTGSEEDIPF